MFLETYICTNQDTIQLTILFNTWQNKLIQASIGNNYILRSRKFGK